MFCSKCGAQIADNAKFCPKCGAKVTTPGSQQTQSQGSNAKPAQPQQTYQSNNSNQQAQSRQTQYQQAQSQQSRQTQYQQAPYQQQNYRPQYNSSGGGGPYAIASLVLSLIGFPTGFLFGLGCILGIVAVVLAVMSKRRTGGSGAATAGLVIGILDIIFGAFYLACTVCTGGMACALL